MQWWKVVKWQFSYSSLRVLQAFERVGDTYAQCVSQHLDSFDGWVGATRLDAGHVRPGQAAPICECFLKLDLN